MLDYSVLFDSYEALTDIFRRKIAPHAMSDFCQLETIDVASDHALVGSKGNLGTMIELKGGRSLMGDSEMREFIERWSTLDTSVLSKGGHALELVIERDPDATSNVISPIIASQRAVARRSGLAMDAIFDEEERLAGRWMTAETVHLVLWTDPSVVLPAERREAQARLAKNLGVVVMAKDAQRPWAVIGELSQAHNDFVGMVCKLLDGQRISYEILGQRRALETMQGFISRDHMRNAKPGPSRFCLPGDRLRPRAGSRLPTRDISDIIWPRLSDQIFARMRAKEVDSRRVIVGPHAYSVISAMIGPEELGPSYNNLIKSIWDSNLRYPWRCRILMFAGGQNDYRWNMNKSVASIMGVISAVNREINSAAEELKAEQESRRSVMKIQISWTTWTKVDANGNFDRAALDSQVARLSSAIKLWGGIATSDIPGDPLEAFMGTIPLLSLNSTGSPGLMPLHECLRMVPLARPESCFDTGAMIFRSHDGKVMPYEIASSKQTHWVNAIIAPPGAGKSVLLNCTNLSYMLTPRLSGAEVLPLLSLIDIGWSAKGFVNLLRDSLPPERRNEAVHYRLSNEKRIGIEGRGTYFNPLDLTLGCRAPLNFEMDFIRTILRQIFMTEEGVMPDGMDGFIEYIVRKTYKIFSDEDSSDGGTSPKRWSEGISPFIDAGIEQAGISARSGYTTYYSLMDQFFDSNHPARIRLATEAMRHAVPTLRDLSRMANSTEVVERFDIVYANTSETISSYFMRVIETAIDQYPILEGPTTLDTGDARVVVLDLDAVAPKDNVRTTSIMYLLAIMAGGKPMYYTTQDWGSYSEIIPPRYREYHEKRIKMIQASPKRQCFDELHRARGSKTVFDAIKIAIRQGRKSGCIIDLCSQVMEDLDSEMIELLTGRLLLGAADSKTDKLIKYFKLEGAAAEIMRNKMASGPSKEGGQVFAQFTLKQGGNHSMFMLNSVGPTKLWAFTTNQRDDSIKSALIEKIGSNVEALRLLATAFPSGSADEEIRRRSSKDVDKSVELLRDKEILNDIVADLYDRWRRQKEMAESALSA